MTTPYDNELFTTIIAIMTEVSLGNTANIDTLFELTRQEGYPPEIVTLAESFGMMVVKNDVKQQHLEQLMDDLREHNRNLEQTVAERTRELNTSLMQVKTANELIRRTFGRYLSEDVVNDILASPDGASLGGESRLITILMTDLRGFTAISERLPATDVLAIINIYLERMTEVVMRYNGTIIEFIGDAILVVFGAPVFRDDDAQRAVACAIEMQSAMADVNGRCRELGYPGIEQGIGINTGESVVGNIGSDKRTKYGIVGMHVNLASRVESYTVGGQVLVSETTARACEPFLTIKDTLEVVLKGVNKPVTIFDIEGIAGDFNVALPCAATAELVELSRGVPVAFLPLEGKHAAMTAYDGVLIRLSRKEAIIQAEMPPEPLANLKLTLMDTAGAAITSDIYAKVIASPCGSASAFKINFTSLAPEAVIIVDRVLTDNGVSR